MKKMPEVDIEIWVLFAFKRLCYVLRKEEKYWLLVLGVVFSRKRWANSTPGRWFSAGPVFPVRGRVATVGGILGCHGGAWGTIGI